MAQGLGFFMIVFGIYHTRLARNARFCLYGQVLGVVLVWLVLIAFGVFITLHLASNAKFCLYGQVLGGSFVGLVLFEVNLEF